MTFRAYQEHLMLNRWLKQLRRELFGKLDPASLAPIRRLSRKSRRRTLLKLECMEERLTPAPLSAPTVFTHNNTVDVVVPAGEAVSIGYVPSYSTPSGGTAGNWFKLSYGGIYASSGNVSVETIPLSNGGPNLNVYLANEPNSPDSLTIGGWGNDPDCSTVNIGAVPPSQSQSQPTVLPGTDTNDTVTLNSLSAKTSISVSADTIDVIGAASVSYAGTMNISSVFDTTDYTITPTNQVSWSTLGFEVGETIRVNGTSDAGYNYGTFQVEKVSGDTLTVSTTNLAYNITASLITGSVAAVPAVLSAPTIDLKSVNSLTLQSTVTLYHGDVSIDAGAPSGQPFSGDPYITGPDWATYGYTPGDAIGLSGLSDNSGSTGTFYVEGTLGDNMYLVPSNQTQNLTPGNYSDVTVTPHITREIQASTINLDTTGSGSTISGAISPLSRTSTTISLSAETEGGNIDIQALPFSVSNEKTSGSTGTTWNTAKSMTLNLGVLNAGTGSFASSGKIQLLVDGPVYDGNSSASINTNPNLIGSEVDLTATGIYGSIGYVSVPIRTDTHELTAATVDGGVYIDNENNDTPLIVNSIVADQDGQAPVVNDNQVVYNSTPSATTPNYSSGSSDVSIVSSGPIVLNSISATGSVAITGVYIVEGNGQSQAIVAQSVRLDATGAANYQGQVTFAESQDGDTLTLPNGQDWTLYGFTAGSTMAGESIVISGASQTANDGTFIIQSISNNTLTLQQSYTLDAETEDDVTVGDGMIGLESPPDSTSTASYPIDLAATDDFNADTSNGNIDLSLGNSVDSTAVSVTAGGTGNVGITSSANFLTVENITATGAQLTGMSSVLGGDVAVAMSSGALIESPSNYGTSDQTPGIINALAVSVSSPLSIGSPSSPLLTNASLLMVSATAKSPSEAGVYVDDIPNLTSVQVSTDDGTVLIEDSENVSTGTFAGQLSFDNNQLSETGSAVVSFANTDDNDGSGDNVDLNGDINASNITAGGQIVAEPSSAIDGQTVVLSAANGIGTPGTPIVTHVTTLDATTTTGNVSINQFALPQNAGSGAIVGIETDNGALISVSSTPISGGSGYPANATFNLEVTGDGGTGGVVEAATNSAGVITAFATTPMAGGGGYANTPSGSVSASTSDSFFLLGASTSNGNITVNSRGGADVILDGISTGTSGEVTLVSDGAILNTSSVNANNSTLSGTSGNTTSATASGVTANTLSLTAQGGIGTAGNPLQTSVNTLTVGRSESLFLANNTALTVSSTSVLTNVSLSTVGSLVLDDANLGSSTSSITLTATAGNLTENGGNLTAATLTVSAENIGSSSRPLQTEASIIDATADYGGIYIDNKSSTLTLTAAAVGPTSGNAPTNNIDISNNGNIVLLPQISSLPGAGSTPIAVYNPGGTVSLTANGATITSAFSAADLVSGLSGHTASLSAGMSVSGPGIPANDTIALVNPTGSSGDGEIELTEPAMATAHNVTLTFGTAPNTDSYTADTTGSPGYIVSGLGGNTTSLSAGMSVSGPGIPANEKIALVNPTGSSSDGEIELTEPATASASGVALTFGTAPNTVSFTGITTGTAGTYYDVYTGTLKIGNSTITSSGSLSGSHYGPLVTETNTAEVAVFAPLAIANAGPLELSASALANGGTFTGSSITIAELGPNPLPISGNLVLEATGAIIFLDPTNTIVSTGSITITTGSVAALGNLETNGGGNITIVAGGNVGVGTVNAGTGTVTITSPGSIFSNSGGGLAITAGNTLLSQAKVQIVAQGNSTSASQGISSLAQLQLNTTEAIAAAAAASAQAGADQTTANAFQAELNSIQTTVTNDQTAYQTDVTATNSANSIVESASNVVNGLTEQEEGLNEAEAVTWLVSAIGGEAASGLETLAGSLEEEPIVGPVLSGIALTASGVTSQVANVFNIVAATLGLSAASLEYTLTADETTLGNDESNLTTDQLTQAQAYAQLQADGDTETAVAAAYNVAQQAGASEEIIALQDEAVAQADSALFQAASAQAQAQGSAQQTAQASSAAVAATATAQPLSVTGSLTITGEAPQSGNSNISLAISAPITVSTASGNTTLASLTLDGNGSPLTVGANIAAPGPIALQAPASAAGGGDLTVNSGVTIQSSSPISLSASGNSGTATGSGATVILDGTLDAPSATIYAGSASTPDQGNDTFTITPSTTTPIGVIGGSGDDTLNFNADGLAVTISGDTITAGNLAPVTFTNIEDVNITNEAGNNLTLEGTTGTSNTMSLVGTGQQAGTVTLNGVAFSFSGTTSISYKGGVGDTIAVTPFSSANVPWNLAVSVAGGTGGPSSLTYNAAGPADTVTSTGQNAGSVVEPGVATILFANVNQVTVAYQGVQNIETLPDLTVSAANGVYNGQAFTATVEVNGAASLDGITPTLTYYSGNILTPADELSGAPIDAGNYTAVAAFAGDPTYASASALTTFTIASGPPQVTVNPVTLTYGTALANSQLSGTATLMVPGTHVSVPGTFSYTSAAGTVLAASASAYPEQVTFTPTNTTEYAPVTDLSVMVTVDRAMPNVTLSPLTLLSGTALANSQLSGTATFTVGGTAATPVPGTYSFTSAVGKVLYASSTPYSEQVTFTPTDTTDYATLTNLTVAVTVYTTPRVAVNSVTLTYGTALANSQLSGSATAIVSGTSVSVPGTFSYTSAAGTLLAARASAYPEQVTFTPTNTTEYATETALSVMVTVGKATPRVTLSPLTLLSGTALANSQLSGTATFTVGGTAGTPVPGTYTFTSAVGRVLNASSLPYSEQVTFTPTDTTDYATLTNLTVAVTVYTIPVLAAVTAGGPATTEVHVTYSNGSNATWDPFGITFTAGGTVALGDVTGTGYPDIIVASGSSGTAGMVKVYDGVTRALIASYTPLGGFGGGLDVAVGNLGGSGPDDIVVGVMGGGYPMVTVLNGATGKMIDQFLAYSTSFGGGVRVAVGDVSGNGPADVVVGPGAGQHSLPVEVYSGPSIMTGTGTPQVLASFTPFASSYTGAVSVAVGALNSTSFGDIVVGTQGSGEQIKVYSGQSLSTASPPTLLFAQNAWATTDNSGVKVALVPDAAGNGYDDLIVTNGTGSKTARYLDSVLTAEGWPTSDAEFFTPIPGVTSGVYVG